MNYLQKLAQRLILSESQSVVGLKKDEFLSGKLPNGERIGGYQDGEYAHFKNQMNPRPGFGNVDLILTGSFIRSADVQPLGEGRYTIDFDDRKTDKLTEKYSDGIHGLNQESFNEFLKENIANDYIREIKKDLQV